MSHNPNTINSQDELNTCNDGKRSSETLIQTISKLETTIEELEKVKKERDTYYKALMQIQYKTSALSGSEEDMTEALYRIDCICAWALRPDEMIDIHKKEIERIKEFTNE